MVTSVYSGVCGYVYWSRVGANYCCLELGHRSTHIPQYTFIHTHTHVDVSCDSEQIRIVKTGHNCGQFGWHSNPVLGTIYKGLDTHHTPLSLDRFSVAVVCVCVFS